jgi:hypothetical protein
VALAGGLRASFLRPIHEKTPKTLTPDRYGFIARAMINAAIPLFARRRRRISAVWAVDRV